MGAMFSHQITRRVRWSETDPAAIVFYPRILEWFDEGSDELCRAAGLAWETTFPRYGVVGLPILEVNCRFHAPMRYGEDVTITSTVADLRSKVMRVEHTIAVGDRLCAVGHELRAWAGKDESGVVRAMPFPPEVARALRGGEG